MRIITKLVLVIMLLLAGSFELLAQTTNATVSGAITDASGAVVAGAHVVASNADTNVASATDTNSRGIYTFASLPPGRYRLSVAKDGFRSVNLLDVVVHVQDQISQNFVLQVGTVSESITVSGEGLNVNTSDASVSTVVDQTFVKNMPLNGRSFQDLILLTPGVVTQTPQGSQNILGVSGEFSVNGQRPEENYYTVDGASANVGATGAAGGVMLQGAAPSGSLPGATALGTTQALVSVDELQEFRVQSSTYSAEYGRLPGGQFAFETKSGTDSYHGTAYDYLRNNYFDANDWFNNYFGVKEPALRQNDFGGTLGGPVRVPGLYNGKDRTFFFVSYEGLRLLEPQAARITYVPDATMIDNAPSPLQQALKAYPVANGPDLGNGLGEFISSWSNPNSINSTSVRFDEAVGNKWRLFFRFNDTNSSAATRGGGVYSAGSLDTLGSTIRTYTAGATALFTNRISNDFRLNYTSNSGTDVTSIDSFGGGTPVDLVKLSGLPGGDAARISLQFGGGVYNANLDQGPSSGSQQQWNLVDTTSLTFGPHHVKVGIDYRRLMPVAIQRPVFVNYGYSDESQVDDPTNSSASITAEALAPAYPLYTNFSAFAQDEWKINAKLTLSMGLRWDVNPAPGVTRGQNAYTLIGSGPSDWNLAPPGTRLWNTTWYNFAPRLGVAYLLRSTAGWETVLRSGGGAFFDTGQQLASNGFVLGPGFLAFSPNPGTSFPISQAGIPVVNPGTYPLPPFTWEGFGFAPHLQLPYTIEWNTSVEQELGRSQALTVSYVGAHASRLQRQNFYQPSNNPNTFGFVWIDNGLTSDYDSGQVQFQQRLSGGLTALASYTFSHAIDYGSQNYSIGYQRGNSDLDVRHSVSSAISYNVPNVGHGVLAKSLMHNWGLDNRFTARTGFPVTISGVGFTDPNGRFYDEGLNVVRGQPIYLYGANCAMVLQGLGELQPGQRCPGGRAINANAFQPVDPKTCPSPTAGNPECLGNAPRNFVRGFGAWQMDLAVRREFPIYENLKLQFRAEAFNIFNHPNFGTIGSSLAFAPGQFGLATGTLASTLGVESPLYQMGGPRSMQFALKLVF